MLRMLGLFMVLPVLTLYGQDYVGSSALLLGLAIGVYGLTQAILQIPFGILSDKLGRKPIIAAGLVLFALGSVVAAQSETMFGLIAGRALQGAGAIAGAIMATAADLTCDKSRTRAMAIIGASIGVSFILALIIGPALAAVGGLSLLFWLTAVFAILGLAVLIWWVPTTGVRSIHDVKPVPSMLAGVMRHPQLARLNIGVFILHFVLTAGFLILPVVMEQQLGIDRSSHWRIYLPVMLGSFIAMFPFMMIAERRRKLRTIFLAAVLLLGMAMMALHFLRAEVPSFVGSLFAFFMAFNLLEATLPSLMSKQTPAGARGSASGVYSTCQFAGAFAGGLVGGWLWQNYGEGTVFVLCGALIGLWLVAAWGMVQPAALDGLEVLLTGDLDLAQAKLAKLPGVVEVVVLAHEKVAYLKVDPLVFERESLAESGSVL